MGSVWKVLLAVAIASLVSPFSISVRADEMQFSLKCEYDWSQGKDKGTGTIFFEIDLAQKAYSTKIYSNEPFGLGGSGKLSVRKIDRVTEGAIILKESDVDGIKEDEWVDRFTREYRYYFYDRQWKIGDKRDGKCVKGVFGGLPERAF